MKHLSVDEFSKQSELTTRTLVGYIRYQAGTPDVIYYGVTPNVCPQHPIPKGLIETMQVGNEELPCSGEQIGVMFFCRLVLKQDAAGGGLVRLVVSLATEVMAAGERPSVLEQSHPLSTVLRSGFYILVFPLQGGHPYYVGPYASYQAADAARAGYQPPYANANSPIYLRAGQNFPGT